MKLRYLFLILAAVALGCLALLTVTESRAGGNDRERLTNRLRSGDDVGPLYRAGRHGDEEDDDEEDEESEDNDSEDEDSDDDDGDYGDACSTHAGLLRQACFADGRDDFLVHLADCVYVTSEEDESDCRADARTEAWEKAQECRDLYEARLEVCDLVGEARFDVEFDAADFEDPDDIGEDVDPNPYWPLTAGHTHVIVTDSDDAKEVTVVIVTDEVREVGGIPCRVVRDLVFEEVSDGGDTEYEALEVTQDWYAQHVNGDVIYCGENTYEIEDGLIDNTDGSFANGTDRARAGFLLRANPIVEEGDRQEMATDEAEDYVKYASLGASPSEEEGGDPDAFPCNGACLQTFEVNPRDPGQAEYKYYLRGTGFVVATKLEDGEPTGEREEVSCIGEYPEILENASCDIGDFDALLDALCAWAPEALCLD